MAFIIVQNGSTEALAHGVTPDAAWDMFRKQMPHAEVLVHPSKADAYIHVVRDAKGNALAEDECFIPGDGDYQLISA